MKMQIDEAKEVCTHLRTARQLLKISATSTAAVAHRLEVIEGNLYPDDPTYTGDAGVAKNALDIIVEDLARLRKMRPAVAINNEALIPNVKPELLPGVADAINQIGKAVQILRLVRDG
jgi:hypothetical protein